MKTNHRKPLFLLAAVAAVIGLAPVSCRKPAAPAEPKIRFATDIKPMLAEKCLPCHNTGTLLGELNLESRLLDFTKGSKGPFIVPGKPDESRIYHVLVKPRADDDAMPPEGHAMTPEDIAKIRSWIAQGAEWPQGPEGTLTVPTPDEA